MAYDKKLLEDQNKQKTTDTSLSASASAAKIASGATAGILSNGVGAKIGVKANSYVPQVNSNQQYIDQMNDIYNQIMSRGAFSYDMASDPFYQQYAQQYTQLGKQAMRDTQAQAASLTGGYGNSWAESAGAQSYQNYLNQINSMEPEFYDRAYNEWLAEGDLLATQYNLAATHPGAISALTPAKSSSYRAKPASATPNVGYYGLVNGISNGASAALNDGSDTTNPITFSVKDYKDATGNWPTYSYDRFVEEILKNKSGK